MGTELEQKYVVESPRPWAVQTRLLSAAITNSKASVAAEAAQQSARGFGGGTSFGGGGGFSGGGFGGGSR